MANPNGPKLTSTIGYQYFGKGADGSDKSLSVAYLENNISIGIFSLLPQSQQTDRARFDYNSGNTIYLRGKQAKNLARLLKKAVKSKAEGDAIIPTAVASAHNLIEIADSSEYGMDEGIAIAIYTNINADKTCDAPAVFKFENEKLLTNYNRSNGTYGETLIDSDIDYLIDQLTEFAKGITNASAHCIKKEMSFDIGRIVSRQIQCCQALGINLETAHAARTNWNGGNGGYNNNNYQSSRSSSTSVSNISTDELLKELDSSLS